MYLAVKYISINQFKRLQKSRPKKSADSKKSESGTTA